MLPTTVIDAAHRQRLKLALENINSLPAMPIIAQKLLALPLDTDKGEEQLVELIGRDPQISARLIGLANSPMMGLSRKINMVRDATIVLGLTKVKSVAIAIASMSGFAKLPPGENFNPQDLWLHSMAIAIIMRSVAQSMPRNIRPNEDQIFLTGLLHDIGFMALHHVDHAASNELHLQLQLKPEHLTTEIEMALLGVTHCQIGQQLAQNWNLPPEIVAVLGNHHHDANNPAPNNPLIHLLILAEKLEPDFGINEHTGDAINEDDWLRLGIAPSDADEIINLTNELAMQVAQQGEAL